MIMDYPVRLGVQNWQNVMHNFEDILILCLVDIQQ